MRDQRGDDPTEPWPAAPRRLWSPGGGASVESWLADLRAGAARDARREVRWARQRGEDLATLDGTLVDIAERATPVSVHTLGGRRHQGTLIGIGADVCVLGGDGRLVLVSSAAVVSVTERRAGSGAATGSRPAPGDARLVELLTDWAPERPRVTVTTVDGDVTAGELASVGVDVMSVRRDGTPATVAHIALAAVASVALEHPHGRPSI